MFTIQQAHTEAMRMSLIEWKDGNLARGNLINDALWSASHFQFYVCDMKFIELLTLFSQMHEDVADTHTQASNSEKCEDAIQTQAQT